MRRSTMGFDSIAFLQLGLQYSFTLQYQTEFVIICNSQLCNIHISSTLLFKSLCLVPIHTAHSLFLFPTRSTNRLGIQVFPSFSSHFMFFALSCLIGHQQDKRKKEKVMHECNRSILRMLLNSAFPTASLNIGSQCMPPSQIDYNL